MKRLNLIQWVFAIPQNQMNFEMKINWEFQKALDELIEQHRGKYDYDCIVPFSGKIALGLYII